MDEVESFSPTVTNEELVDLRFRLRSIRWPEAEADPRQGMILDDVKALCEYWAADYDMRRVVKRLDAAGACTPHRSTVSTSVSCMPGQIAMTRSR